jgi:hypothetical protein
VVTLDPSEPNPNTLRIKDIEMMEVMVKPVMLAWQYLWRLYW